MAAGIRAFGDRAIIRPLTKPAEAEVAVCYGWKHHLHFAKYPQYLYADIGYWDRERYYRFSANGWAPQVKRGLPGDRFARLGLEVKPWRRDGRQIVVAGSTGKACRDHGLAYMEWEKGACERLAGSGLQVVYRPKPRDPQAKAIPGFPLDQRPIGDALKAAKLWVTHHSNSALDALIAGVPIHCEMGAASALSSPLGAEPNYEDRQDLLNGCAYLQWTLDEMRSGEAWAHLRTYVC
jgi:hypothetical protein